MFPILLGAILGALTFSPETSGPGNINTGSPNTASNLAVFMVLFMICAMEVVFIKIATSSYDDSENESDSGEVGYRRPNSTGAWLDQDQD